MSFHQIKRRTGNYSVPGVPRVPHHSQEQFCGNFSCSIFLKYAINSTQKGQMNALKVSSMII